MGVFKVWVPSREHMSVQALYDAAIVLYWKILERQNSTHLAFLKHQNTKTSLYKLSKNHWVITLLGSFGSVRRELQSTVSLDHPVSPNCQCCKKINLHFLIKCNCIPKMHMTFCGVLCVVDFDFIWDIWLCDFRMGNPGERLKSSMER